ncbi:MAG: hypothetical protein WCO10_02040 [bacterium]
MKDKSDAYVKLLAEGEKIINKISSTSLDQLYSVGLSSEIRKMVEDLTKNLIISAHRHCMEAEEVIAVKSIIDLLNGYLIYYKPTHR